MNMKFMRTVIVLLLCFALVAWVNYSGYQVHIMLYKVTHGAISGDLVRYIALQFLSHLAVLSAVPLVLSLAGRPIATWVGLFLAVAIYVGYMAGVNVGGAALLLVVIAWLLFLGGVQGRRVISRFRS